jgi:hypothetical protein
VFVVVRTAWRSVFPRANIITGMNMASDGRILFTTRRLKKTARILYCINSVQVAGDQLTFVYSIVIFGFSVFRFRSRVLR